MTPLKAAGYKRFGAVLGWRVGARTEIVAPVRVALASVVVSDDGKLGLFNNSVIKEPESAAVLIAELAAVEREPEVGLLLVVTRATV